MSLWIPILALGAAGLAGCAPSAPARSPEKPEEAVDDEIIAQALRSISSMNPPPDLDRGCARSRYAKDARTLYYAGQNDGVRQKCEIVRYVIEHPELFPELSKKLSGGEKIPWDLGVKRQIVRETVQSLKLALATNGFDWNDSSVQKDMHKLLRSMARRELGMMSLSERKLGESVKPEHLERFHVDLLVTMYRLGPWMASLDQRGPLLKLSPGELDALGEVDTERERHLFLVFASEAGWGMEIHVEQFGQMLELGATQYLADHLLSRPLRSRDLKLPLISLAVYLDPDSKEGHRRYADALHDSGRYTEAAASLRQIVTLDPSETTAYKRLAWALHGTLLPKALKENEIPDVSREALENARKLLEEGLAQNPNDAELHFLLGAAKLAQELLPARTTWGKLTFSIDGALKNVVPHFEKAIALKTDEDLPYLVVGIHRLRQNPKDEMGHAFFRKGLSLGQRRTHSIAPLLLDHLSLVVPREAQARIERDRKQVDGLD